MSVSDNDVLDCDPHLSRLLSVSVVPGLCLIGSTDHCCLTCVLGCRHVTFMAAFTIARMPALSASGRAGQRSRTWASSGSASAREWQRDWQAPAGQLPQVIESEDSCGFVASVPKTDALSIELRAHLKQFTLRHPRYGRRYIHRKPLGSSQDTPTRAAFQGFPQAAAFLTRLRSDHAARTSTLSGRLKTTLRHRLPRIAPDS